LRRRTAVGACPDCHGLGRIHPVTEETLVPDPSLTIREGAVAAWPGAWQGQNLRDIGNCLDARSANVADDVYEHGGWEMR
jgi:excinuclease UvrABC ATPase subunit